MVLSEKVRDHFSNIDISATHLNQNPTPSAGVVHKAILLACHGMKAAFFSICNPWARLCDKVSEKRKIATTTFIRFRKLRSWKVGTSALDIPLNFAAAPRLGTDAEGTISETDTSIQKTQTEASSSCTQPSTSMDIGTDSSNGARSKTPTGASVELVQSNQDQCTTNSNNSDVAMATVSGQPNPRSSDSSDYASAHQSHLNVSSMLAENPDVGSVTSLSDGTYASIKSSHNSDEYSDVIVPENLSISSDNWQSDHTYESVNSTNFSKKKSPPSGTNLKEEGSEILV